MCSLTNGKDLSQFIELANLNRPMRAQHLGKYPRFTAEPTGVTGDRPLSPSGATHLENDYRLASLGGSIKGRYVVLRITDAFGESRNHTGGWIINELIHVVSSGHNRFVTRRYDDREPEAPCIGHEADTHRAALRNNCHVAG